MSWYAWTTRCIPAFSCAAVIVLLVFAFIVQPFGKGEKGHHNGEVTPAQFVLSIYTVLLHVMSIMFPARVCWSMHDMIRRMKEANAVMPNTRRRRVASMKSDEGDITFPVPLFVIILPAYKEEMETLEMTLQVLASHSQARHCYHVRFVYVHGSKFAQQTDVIQIYLAMEEKEEKSALKAATLVSSFKKSFYKMSYTIHPANIPGEAQGKSSNESWAAKQAGKDYSEPTLKENIIMTVMDGAYSRIEYTDRLLMVPSGHPPLVQILSADRSPAHRVC